MNKTKKIPQILKQIKNQPVREINYALEKSISYSQFSMFQTCPYRWSLQYRDGLYMHQSSIHMTFGTSLHETIQHYITTIYNHSGVEADKINLGEYFENRFRENYLKDYKSNKNVHFSDSVEMNEFFEDGIAILEFIKKKRGVYFGKRKWTLVGCELPVIVVPNPKYPNILYQGYLDVVLYHEDTNSFKIIDIKTSTKGWGVKEKKDETKQFQLILYKKFFSQQYNIPVENIDVEFFIVRRKIWEESEFPIGRVQEFTPANGKVKLNKAHTQLTEFIEEAFESNGSYRSKEYAPNPSASNCRFCPFKKDHCKIGYN